MSKGSGVKAFKYFKSEKFLIPKVFILIFSETQRSFSKCERCVEFKLSKKIVTGGEKKIENSFRTGHTKNVLTRSNFLFEGNLKSRRLIRALQLNCN